MRIHADPDPLEYVKWTFISWGLSRGWDLGDLQLKAKPDPNHESITDLDVFPLVFEVYPGVRVAPDEDSEEEGAQRGGEEHHHQPEESLVTRRHQRSVVQPGK